MDIKSFVAKRKAELSAMAKSLPVVPTLMIIQANDDPASNSYVRGKIKDGEEIGFIGLLMFFALIGFIVYRGMRAASRAKDLFGFLLALGITMIFGIQAVINALVVTGSIPPTGLPLPLVSSGNTAIIIFMADMGIIGNISKKGALTF